jgi:hypothetical protein
MMANCEQMNLPAQSSQQVHQMNKIKPINHGGEPLGAVMSPIPLIFDF